MDRSRPNDRSVGSVIEDIGMGPYQVIEALISFGGWLADGAEVLLISSVIRAVSESWNLSATKTGAIVAVIYVGVLIGNLASGPFSDRVGRRKPVIVGLMAVSMFSVVSAFALGFWSLAFARFLVGLGFGLCQPASNTYILEIATVHWRTILFCAGQILFSVGEAYAAWILMLEDPTLQHLRWRMLLLVGAVPACMLTVICAICLGESPSWLASNGHKDQAVEVLTSMATWNGAHLGELGNVRSSAKSEEGMLTLLRQSWDLMFGRTLLYSTLVVCFTCFSLNFLYYGGLYAFPQVLGTSVHTGSTAAVALLVGVAWEMPGVLVVAALGHLIDRRLTLMVSLSALAVSVAMFIYGGTCEAQSWFAFRMVQVGYAQYKCIAVIAFLTAYQYSVEIYPIRCRAAGSALSMAVGRLGAISSSLMYEWLEELSGTWYMYFVVLAVMLVANVILVAFLPFETRGKMLRDSIQEDQEAGPLLIGCSAADASSSESTCQA